ncbi:MAG: M81 family metallopeptidase, partial [Rhodothermales bacterium]
MKRRRVGIVGLLQESNTFVASTTTLEHFRDDLLLEGAAVRDRMIDAPHEVGGFFEGLESAGIEAVPIFLARAVP